MNVSSKTILLRHIVIYFQNIAFCHGHVCDSLCSDQIEADCLQLGGFATVDNVPVLRPARLRLSFSYCCSCLEGICLKPRLLSLAVLPVHSVHTHRDLHMSAVPTSTRSECSFEETQCSRLCQSQCCSDEVASTVTRTKTQASAATEGVCTSQASNQSSQRFHTQSRGMCTVAC